MIVTMKVDTVMESGYSQNVIGTIPAKREVLSKSGRRLWWPVMTEWILRPQPTTTPGGPQRCWNWPGCCAKKPMFHDVKVIFFGAEEAGLVGSTHYVESLDPREIADIAAMINMDMVGVGDTMGVMTAEEGAESFVADLAEEYIRAYGHPYRRTVSTAAITRPLKRRESPWPS